MSPTKAKRVLLKMKEQLLMEITNSRKVQNKEFDTDIGDLYDSADAESGKQMYHLFSDRERQKLIEIDEALKRIEEGSYGICEECGKRINPARLKAMPLARLCINCKAELEKKTGKVLKEEIEEFGYLDASLTEMEDFEE